MMWSYEFNRHYYEHNDIPLEMGCVNQDLLNQEHPLLEHRKIVRPVEDAKRDLDTTRDCEFVYEDIHDSILSSRSSGAWVGPTPLPAVAIMQVIGHCWEVSQKLGFYPGGDTPENMSKEDIDKVISELDQVLWEEGIPWFRGAGYTALPCFGHLDDHSKACVVAEIQRALKDNQVDYYLKIKRNNNENR